MAVDMNVCYVWWNELLVLVHIYGGTMYVYGESFIPRVPRGIVYRRRRRLSVAVVVRRTRPKPPVAACGDNNNNSVAVLATLNFDHIWNVRSGVAKHG